MIITFRNHRPIRISNIDTIITVWSAEQPWGCHKLRCYTTQHGQRHCWAAYNSGEQHNGRAPETVRTYLDGVAAVREYFESNGMEDVYHAEIESRLDPTSIVDVDNL